MKRWTVPTVRWIGDQLSLSVRVRWCSCGEAQGEFLSRFSGMVRQMIRLWRFEWCGVLYVRTVVYVFMYVL